MRTRADPVLSDPSVLSGSRFPGSLAYCLANTAPAHTQTLKGTWGNGCGDPQASSWLPRLDETQQTGRGGASHMACALLTSSSRQTLGLDPWTLTLLSMSRTYIGSHKTIVLHLAKELRPVEPEPASASR